MATISTEPLDLDSLDPTAWLTTAEVAASLRVKYKTFADIGRRGEGPAFYRVGRQIRYRVEDVIEWRDSLRHE